MKLVAVTLGVALWATTASAQAPVKPEPLKLWKLDCGRLDENRERPWAWQKAPTPVSCFLIANGSRYLLWDTGVSRRALNNAHPVIKLDQTISDQLARLNIRPDQIEFVGISHYHGDHTGQATQFPKATLLIGEGDFLALKTAPPPGGAAPTHIQPWIDGTSKVEALRSDHDVFGDGRVTILTARGHTPGHSVLLLKMATGPVILAGDLWFNHDAAVLSTMPEFNTSRAETIASRERIARLGEKLDAMVIIQHEPADLAKLPAFPQAAE